MFKTIVLTSALAAMLGATSANEAPPELPLPMGNISTHPQAGGWMTRNIGPVMCTATKLGINVKQGPTPFMILVAPMVAFSIIVNSEAATALAAMTLTVDDPQWTGVAQAIDHAWIVRWPITTVAEANAFQPLLNKMRSGRQLTLTVGGVQHKLDLTGFATMTPDYINDCFLRFILFSLSQPK